jgi:hypothetical protein
MLRMCVYMHSRFVENHLIRILEDRPLISEVVLSQNRKEDYLEFCKLWSSSAFKAKFEKKRLNHGKDPKHRYDTDGHVRKSQHMIRFHGSSAICNL